MTNFYINDNHLMFGNDKFKMPHPSSDLVNADTFMNDLNRRATKMDLTSDMISVDDNYVYLNTTKVKFPNSKSSHASLKVYAKTHELAKIGAKKAGITIQDYVHLCMVQCQSDRKDI